MVVSQLAHGVLEKVENIAICLTLLVPAADAFACAAEELLFAVLIVVAIEAAAELQPAELFSSSSWTSLTPPDLFLSSCTEIRSDHST